MKLEQQPESLDRVHLPVEAPQRNRHSRLYPSTLRCIVAGPSGSGKTDLIQTLLLHKNGLSYENVYICAKTLHQDKYQLLKDVFSKIPKIGYYLFDNVEDIDIDTVKPNSVFIFDDVINCKQNVIRDIFCYGRHKYIDVIYLVQTFTKVPKHLIRDNANLFVLFKQDRKNLKNFHSDNIVDVSFSEFTKMCSECWSTPHGYIVIALEYEKNRGRYRNSFDKFIVLD